MSGIPLLSVTTMQISILTSDPPQIAVTVQGYAGTPGWTDLRLVPDEGELSPDGILDLTLTGTPPSGVIQQVLTPVSASIIWTHEVERVIGIRALSRTDSLFRFVNSTPLPGPADPTLISDLTGRTLRVLRPGDPVTADSNPTRMNIEVDFRREIQRIWFG